jgi:hypothetical protein
MAKVIDGEGALNEAAQQHLLETEFRPISVQPPGWLHLPERKATPVLGPKPSFERLDSRPRCGAELWGRAGRQRKSSEGQHSAQREPPRSAGISLAARGRIPGASGRFLDGPGRAGIGEDHPG